MVSTGRQNRVDNPEGPPYTEERIVNTPQLRYSRLTMKTDRQCVSVLRDRFMDTFHEFGITVDTGPMQICMALEEALANAFYHGNLELDSALKEDGSDTFMQLARERCEQSPWKERAIYASELATPFGLWITIADEGRGFDVPAAIERIANPVDLLASGRGLLMMKSFSDELIFNPTGNEVTLVFYTNKNQDVIELLKERGRHLNAQTQRTVV
ncbi:MAG: ATP-binding protein [Planctomycetaceae bacterium]|nr:ATP-binding protein [Planctomycetaceae bacterium]